MSNQPKALMTQYMEGALVSRELRDMLNESAATQRFDKELAAMDTAHHGYADSEINDSYQDFIREQVNAD